MVKQKNCITKKIIKKIICISFLLIISCSNEKSKSREKLNLEEEGLTISELNESELIGKSFILYNMFADYNINISFYDANNQVFGFAGVNTYRTSYSKNGDEVKFSGITRTKMSGPKDIMDAENNYVKYLESTKYMFLKDNDLIIITSDSTELKFRENIIDTNELNGKKFRLSNMLEGTEITISIESGSFVGNSGVNIYNIPFELKNNEITIGQHGMSTLMAGPEEDMKAEDEYMKLLNSAKYISFDNYNLCIKTADNQILLFDLTE
ncbi:META domain-containing protein [Brachyspira aalborgi]|uniref:META domain-containing protein n=1 Tax=Brachyspira aalborgi TaxID=29522 RepID=A0A5C8FT77_9SPIR|nr:META domain-containing protein [Brachyspira aalborgi]TXJ52780.1 META domain-containing protein [Brachyspira aalborgi]